jgi:hypothetical protein
MSFQWWVNTFVIGLFTAVLLSIVWPGPFGFDSILEALLQAGKAIGTCLAFGLPVRLVLWVCNR